MMQFEISYFDTISLKTIENFLLTLLQKGKMANFKDQF